MDIDILLALQAFREGMGGCLTEFFSKMTWFGEMGTTLAIMVISLVINPLLRAALVGFVGIVVTCSLQVFYVVFAFPLAIAMLSEMTTESAANDKAPQS